MKNANNNVAKLIMKVIMLQKNPWRG